MAAEQVVPSGDFMEVEGKVSKFQKFFRIYEVVFDFVKFYLKFCCLTDPFYKEAQQPSVVLKSRDHKLLMIERCRAAEEYLNSILDDDANRKFVRW